MRDKIRTPRGTQLQAPKSSILDQVDGCTIYGENGAYNVIGRFGGRVYKVRSQSEKKARACACEWIYLHNLGELY